MIDYSVTANKRYHTADPMPYSWRAQDLAVS